MAPGFVSPFLSLLAVVCSANAYFLMSLSTLTVERVDPLVNPGVVSGHVHNIVGGSNFGPNMNSTKEAQKSACTSAPIAQDKSNYWFPSLYRQSSNGTFSIVPVGVVIYYLYPDNAVNITPFPDDFHMIAGDPTLRTYDASSHAQQAITFLCLNYESGNTLHHELPTDKHCPNGIRGQINFPSCWDGVNVDSPDHKSHVAYRSEGPDSGTCNDSKFPKELPRIFMEAWFPGEDGLVFSYGDPTGYGFHADFMNGWEDGVLEKVINGCNCNPSGDPTCCAEAGIFDYKKEGSECHVTSHVDEIVTGMLDKLPGNNPVQTAKDAVNGHIKMFADPHPPRLLAPVNVYTTRDPPADTCKLGPGGNCPSAPGASAAPPASSSSSTNGPKPTSPSGVPAPAPSKNTTPNNSAPAPNKDTPTPGKDAPTPGKDASVPNTGSPTPPKNSTDSSVVIPEDDETDETDHGSCSRRHSRKRSAKFSFKGHHRRRSH